MGRRLKVLVGLLALGLVEFQTTTFGATFTSAIFPCTPDSLAAGSCGLDNPASFPAGFPVDQPDPITGTKTVTFPVAGSTCSPTRCTPTRSGWWWPPTKTTR